MSNLCDVCLEPRLCAVVTGIYPTQPVSDFVLGAVSVNTLCASHPRSVANFAGLLALGDTISSGTVMFVEDVAVPVIYNNSRWLGLDGRVFIDNTDRGIAWTSGLNTGGALGDGTLTSRSSPVTLAGGGTAWCQVDTGSFSAGIKTDGTAWTWGFNTYGRLGDGTTANRSLPGTVSGDGTTWRQISAGTFHSAAIKFDGVTWSAWTWGVNTSGRLGDNTTVNRCVPVAVVHANGNTLWCQISAGVNHTAAVKTDGTAWTWGSNLFGQLGDLTATAKSSPVAPSGTNSNWCQISAGNCHTAAVKTNGSAWTWGRNDCGQLGDNTIAPRSLPGTVAGTGNTWCQIDAGDLHTAAVKTDGSAWTWGRNACGQLGDGTIAPRSSPGTVSGGGTTWCQISAGGGHTAAVKTDSTAWAWGFNSSGQLGDGTVVCRCSPVAVANGSTTWCQISAGSSQTIFVTLTRSA